jgi:hypothetical protein
LVNYARDSPKFSQRPAAERLHLVGLFISLLVLPAWCWVGATADFWSSAKWFGPSWWISAAVTAACLFLLLRQQGFASLKRKRGRGMYVVMLTFVFAMLTCACWLLIGRLVPDIWTRAVGSRHEAFGVMRDLSDTATPLCNLHLSDDEMQLYFPPDYCPHEGDLKRLPLSGPVRVTSYKSWFGHHIDPIEPIGADNAPRK